MFIYEDFQKLGIDKARIEKLILTESKNLSFLIKNREKISELSRGKFGEFSNVNLEQMNKWSGGDLESFKFIVNNYSKLEKLSISSVNLEHIDKWTGGNLQSIEFLYN